MKQNANVALADRLKRLAKGALYQAGILRAWHRRRNRGFLTVVGFHRVLSPVDPRYPGSNPAYTVTPAELDRCLALLRSFYSFVTIKDVIDARAARRALPPYPLLVTFDDGWRDNLEYALPVLKRHRVRAVVFVATGFIGSDKGFWQEEVYDGVRRGRFAAADADALVAELNAMPREARTSRLSQYPPAQDLPARMAGVQDLLALRSAGVAIGGHGHSHEPITSLANPADEFARCRAALRAIEPADEPLPFSFPHGRLDDSLVAIAHQRGFDPLFTSAHELVATTALAQCGTIGRIEMDLQSMRRGRAGFDAASFLHFVLSQPRRSSP
ncbi:MAG: polysaccharide deacetylase family protein [Alphaproteobacteria bacterium]|nr:polysaccharide deacetylase family protein [Alphaproteobacteria bacterium]